MKNFISNCNSGKENPKRVVFTEADNYKILKAAQISIEEGTAVPILLGQRSKINQLIEENGLVFDNVQIIDPAEEHESVNSMVKNFMQCVNEKE